MSFAYYFEFFELWVNSKSEGKKIRGDKSPEDFI